MSRHTARVRAGNDRANLYTEITEKIIAELEAGRIPWVQPCGTAAIKAPLAMPRNASWQTPKELMTIACGLALGIAYAIGKLAPATEPWIFLAALAVGLASIARSVCCRTRGNTVLD